MPDPQPESGPVASRELAVLLRDARAALRDVPQESLATLTTPRRVLGVRRAPRLVAAGTAWHLGVLLLGDDTLSATGQIVRSREPAPRGYTAQSQRERAALAEAAFRGGFPAGTPVHVGWRALEPTSAPTAAPESGPLRRDGGAGDGGGWQVRWSPAAGFMPLASYLEEQIRLLRNPPPGSG